MEEAQLKNLDSAIADLKNTGGSCQTQLNLC